MRNVHALAVQLRTFSSFGGKKLVAHRIVNHRGHQRPILSSLEARRSVLKAHGNTKLRQPVGKVRGPIQRVNIPAILAVEPLPRSLFAVNPVPRKNSAEPFLDQLLRRPVGHCDNIYAAFVLGLHALGQELAQSRARLFGDRRSLGNPDQLWRRGFAQEATTEETGLRDVEVFDSAPFPGATRGPISVRGPRCRPISEMLRI